MTKDMTRGTPWKLIVQFALPIMAGNLLQQLYNTADTIIVGNFNGQQALSAVGSCASLTALFTALAAFVAAQLWRFAANYLRVRAQTRK